MATKEAKGQVGKAQKVAADCRRQNVELKRLLRNGNVKLHVSENNSQPRPRKTRWPAFDSRQNQFAPARRLGLSADDYAKLVGVSPLTVRHWEAGKARPRKAQLAALVAVRGIGKAEAMAKLAAH